ncbi:MAG: hypothetical protein ABJA82_08265 [Myxococcales bacterium]
MSKRLCDDEETPALLGSAGSSRWCNSRTAARTRRLSRARGGSGDAGSAVGIVAGGVVSADGGGVIDGSGAEVLGTARTGIRSWGVTVGGVPGAMGWARVFAATGAPDPALDAEA